jgi:hypothetical protein
LIALVVAAVAASSGDRTDEAERRRKEAEAAKLQALRTELEKLSLSALIARATLEGAEQAGLEAAVDATNPRAAVVQLIVDTAVGRTVKKPWQLNKPRDSRRPHHSGHQSTLTGARESNPQSSLDPRVSEAVRATPVSATPAPTMRSSAKARPFFTLPEGKHCMLSYQCKLHPSSFVLRRFAVALTLHLFRGHSTASHESAKAIEAAWCPMLDGH